MTSRARLAAALCALLALAGCGSSSDGDGAKATPSSSPTTASLTAAQAKAAAAAAILTAADLPGYAVEAQEADPEDAADDAALAACIGVAKPTYLTRDLGRSFSKGDLEVDSSADVATSAAAAKAELDAYISPKGVDCVRTQLSAYFTKQGLTVGSFTATPTSVTVPGADAVFAFEIALDASAPDGSKLQLRGFEMGSLVGQVEVSLTAIGTPTTNLTLAEAQALLATSTDRVKSAL
jgi:hypothetical protein